MPISIKSKIKLAEQLLQVDFLTDREKDILKMRLGIGGYHCCTLQEIGDKYGITRERVRQIGSAIARRTKKHIPDQAITASKLFSKAWEPKYMARKKQIALRKAVIRRNRSLVRKKYQKLVESIVEFSKSGEGKQKIDALFKELRIKYRRNKSLFDDYLVDELKRWRQRYIEIKRKGVAPSAPIIEPAAPVVSPEAPVEQQEEKPQEQPPQEQPPTEGPEQIQ